MPFDFSFSLKPSENLKPSEVQRFSTKEILLHFIHLMDPATIGKLNPKTQAKLVTISHDLAQAGKDLQNPFPHLIEVLRKHLGTPSKGSKALDTLTKLTTFENNYLPNLGIQQEELQKARGLLESQYLLLFSQSSNLDRSKVENLLADLKTFKEYRVQNFLAQKKDVGEALEPLKEEIKKLSGNAVSTEEAPAETKAQPLQNK